jgi:hypothetical protein
MSDEIKVAAFEPPGESKQMTGTLSDGSEFKGVMYTSGWIKVEQPDGAELATRWEKLPVGAEIKQT